MYPLKQSTALTVLVFAHDGNGDAVTGVVNASFTKRISKDGGAFAAMTVTITELENGWYSLPVSTAHSDTLGLLTVTLTAAGIKQINVQFRVHARLPDDLAYPTVSGRSLDVTATGEAGIDWANIGAPTTSQTLSGTTVSAVSGAVGSVGAGGINAASFAAGAIDATAIAADAIGSSELAASAVTEIQSAVSAGSVASVSGSVGSVVGNVGGNVVGSVGSVTGAVGSVTGAVGSVGTGGITAATFAAGAIDATAIATDAIGASELAASAVTEIQTAVAAGAVGSVTGAVGSVTGNVGGNVVGSVGSVVGAVASVTGNVGGNVAGSVGSLGATAKADVNAEVVDVLVTDTYPEPTIVPSATSSLKDKICWFFTQSRNKLTQTSTTTLLRNDADSGTIASAAVSDDGTTFTRSEWT